MYAAPPKLDARVLYALILWAAACLLAAAAPAGAAADDGRIVVRQALTAPGGGDTFPTNVPTQTVNLPDRWDRSRPDFGGSLWYRVRFDAPARREGGGERGELLALLVEHVCSNLLVVLNGRLVASGGRMSPPYTHNCNHPQLVTLPEGLLQPGANTIDIRVVGHRRAEVGSADRSGGISALVIGPHRLLERQHATRMALAVAAPQGASATLVLMGGFMFVLGFINRRESHLAYFGALAVGTALVDARLWLRDLPFGHTAAEFWLLSLLGFVAWAAVQFLLRYAGLRLRVADVGLPAQTAAIAISLMIAGAAHVEVVATFWTVVLVAEIAAAGALHLRRRAGSPSGRLMAVLLAAVGISAVVQWAAAGSGLRPAWQSIAQLVVPAALMLAGLRLIQQHGRALQHAEIGKAQLEQRVREATAEIERNFRQLSELKVEQVTERERKRIAADLHDDLGAKLLTIVHTSDSERISTLAREALEEMRLSVRGLTGKPVQLSDALGDWRAEVIARLRQAGIEGEWHAPDELPQTLSSRAYVQTTRILREATSNIIKHSGATACSVHCTIADGDFLVVVQDNGNGIATEVEGRLDRGHGLASMKNRAKQLQGQCLVESGPGYGTVIRLTLPLDRALGTS